MADAATIIRSNGGFVQYATDVSAYTFFGFRQIAQFAATSSARDGILKALSNAGFTVTQIGGGPEFPRGTLSTNTPLTFWQAQ